MKGHTIMFYYSFRQISHLLSNNEAFKIGFYQIANFTEAKINFIRLYLSHIPFFVSFIMAPLIFTESIFFTKIQFLLKSSLCLEVFFVWGMDLYY